MDTFLDDNREVTLRFESSNERRYLVDVTQDLKSWEEHYLAPFKDPGEGIKVRQVGEYAPASEFYRMAVLPFRYQSLDVSGDWFGDISMSRLPDGRTAFIYQNRDRRMLHYGECAENGSPPVVERVAGSTGAQNPVFWDTSGYTDLTLQIGPSGVPHVVGRDYTTNDIVLLRKPSGATVWDRRVIRSGLASPYWAFPKFAISPQGMLGVAYRGDDGSYFTHALITAPDSWTNIKISDLSPHGAFETGLIFNNSGDAIIQAGGWFRRDAATGETTPLYLSGQVQTRRGSDGCLLTLDGGFDGTRIRRSTDGGVTWSENYAARQNIGDSGAVSVDCDLQGRLSIFRPPSLYRQLVPGGCWKRVTLRGGAIHSAIAEGRIQMVLIEYDREISLVTED